MVPLTLLRGQFEKLVAYRFGFRCFHLEEPKSRGSRSRQIIAGLDTRNLGLLFLNVVMRFSYLTGRVCNRTLRVRLLDMEPSTFVERAQPSAAHIPSKAASRMASPRSQCYMRSRTEYRIKCRLKVLLLFFSDCRRCPNGSTSVIL
jgi:hypothetical protein